MSDAASPKGGRLTAATTRTRRPPRAAASGPRWILVRQGEGPARKWIWQLAGPPGEGADLRQ